jgi:membrane protein YdbS with pleckstrin-like domain
MLIKPDRGQRTVWFIHWSLWFFPVLIALLILMVIEPLVFALFAVGWIVLNLFIALWLPAYFRSLEYTVAGDAVKGQRGVFFKRHVSMPYNKITNVDITHGPLQRKFGVGYIHCQTAGAGGQQGARAELKMEGIRDLGGVKEAIMERVRLAGGAASGPDVLQQMLGELRVIRQSLEKTSFVNVWELAKGNMLVHRRS